MAIIKEIKSKKKLGNIQLVSGQSIGIKQENRQNQIWMQLGRTIS